MSGQDGLRIVSLDAGYSGNTVIREISLSVAPGETLALVGPSGCGKTTLLRALAGFADIQNGDALVNGQSIINLPPRRRGIALVFQDFALFPHLSAAGNIAFGLEARGAAKRDAHSRAADWLSRVGLKDKQNASPGELSGGEKQRVAFARALAVEPSVLLLDEPLSNIDAVCRSELRSELKRLIASSLNPDCSVIYVTHDRAEAFAVATRIGVMRDGRLVAAGDPRALYSNPPTEFVCGFLGDRNWFDAEAIGSTNDGLRVRLADGQTATVRLSEPLKQKPRTDIKAVRLMCRPESVRFVQPFGGGLRFDATVVSTDGIGLTETLRLSVGLRSQPSVKAEWRAASPALIGVTDAITAVVVPDDQWLAFPAQG